MTLAQMKQTSASSGTLWSSAAFCGRTEAARFRAAGFLRVEEAVCWLEPASAPEPLPEAPAPPPPPWVPPRPPFDLFPLPRPLFPPLRGLELEVEGAGGAELPPSAGATMARGVVIMDGRNSCPRCLRGLWRNSSAE